MPQWKNIFNLTNYYANKASRRATAGATLQSWIVPLIKIGNSWIKNTETCKRQQKLQFVLLLHYLILKRFPVHLLQADVDLELSLHLSQNAGTLLFKQEAGHTRPVYCNGSGTDRVYDSLQHLISHLASTSPAIDLSFTLIKDDKLLIHHGNSKKQKGSGNELNSSFN